LDEAQIGINVADGKLYIRLLSGVVICVGADVSGFATAADLENIDLTDYALQATLTQALTGITQQLAQLSQTLSALQTDIDGKQQAGNYALFTGVTGPFTANVLEVSNHIVAGTQFRVGTDKVCIAPPRWGWQTPTGLYSTAAFNPQSVTLAELGKRVAAIQRLLIAHGLASPYGTTIT
jgi:inactivated superfamily I helicase